MKWEMKTIKMEQEEREVNQFVNEIDKEKLIEFVLETRHILESISFAGKPIKNTSRQDVYKVVEELVNKFMSNRPFVNDAGFLIETFLKESK